MDPLIIPATEEPWQIQQLSVSPNGRALQAKVELRYLPAPDQWVLSVTDGVTGEGYVNQIPLIASRVQPNDLFAPFSYLFQGVGLGSLYVLKAGENTTTQDPAKGNLSEFNIVWCDRVEGVCI